MGDAVAWLRAGPIDYVLNCLPLQQQTLPIKALLNGSVKLILDEKLAIIHDPIYGSYFLNGFLCVLLVCVGPQLGRTVMEWSMSTRIPEEAE